MDKFRIVGGNALRGSVRVSGAKNSALPCLAASLLAPETVTLGNVPYVRDLITMRRLLEDLGATVLVPELHTHRINAGTVDLFSRRDGPPQAGAGTETARPSRGGARVRGGAGDVARYQRCVSRGPYATV